MLKPSSSSISTQVDEIEELDFTELYENIAVIYDFFDKEVAKTGNENMSIINISSH